jgi:hypothetical protein
VAAAITGHHAGLADWNTRFKEKMLDRRYRDETFSLVERACADSVELKHIISKLLIRP